MPDLWWFWRRASGTSPRAAVGGVAVGAAIAGVALNAWWSEERGLWSAQRDLMQQEIDSLRGQRDRMEQETDSLRGHRDRLEQEIDSLPGQQPSVLAPREPEQLSILIFNAIRDEPVRTRYGSPAIDSDFYWAVNQLKRVLNDCSIDTREYWEGRAARLRTQVYFQGVRAERAAREIVDLLPGNQGMESLESSTLWGIHEDRDVIMLLGRDARYITEGLSETENRSCPRLGGQPGTG